MAMLGVVAVMADRCTASVVAAWLIVASVGGWLVLGSTSTSGDGSAVLVALTAVLVMAAATAAVNGGEAARARPTTPVLAVIATTTAFCVAIVPAFYIGIPAGMMAQSLAGGELGADGLPLLMGGVVAGLSGLAGYAAVLMRRSGPVADEPIAHSTRKHLIHDR
jgi:hypothetical protein